MTALFTDPYFFLMSLLFWGVLQVASAAPAPTAPTASKPKLAPRPVPGMTSAAPASPVRASRPNAPATPKAGSATPGSTSDQVRILMIYRGGSLPAPSPDSKSVARTTIEPKPATVILPRPGQVRIISKAEADLLAAQPVLSK